MNQDHLEECFDPAALHCPDCNAVDIETTHVDDSFTYGEGPIPATLHVRLPVRKCGNCGLTFLDREAEDLRHAAVCRHLGVMTPAEIRDIRARLRLSQSALASLTKLGTATISRWERGICIQNEAYDQFLYLLGFSDNVERLQQRATDAPIFMARGSDPMPTFRAITVDFSLLSVEQSFQL